MAMKRITPTPPDGPPPKHLRLSSRSSVENKAHEEKNEKEKDKEKEKGNKTESDKKKDNEKDNEKENYTEARLSSWDFGWILQSLGSASTSQLAELRSSIDDEMTSRRMTTSTMTTSTSLPSDPTPPWLGPLSHSKAIQDIYDNASQYELRCARTDPLVLLDQVDEQFAARTRPFKAWIGLEEHENAKLRIDANPDPKGLRFTFPPKWAEERRVMTCCLYLQHPDGGKKWHLYADSLPIGEFPEMPVMPPSCTLLRLVWFSQPDLVRRASRATYYKLRDSMRSSKGRQNPSYEEEGRQNPSYKEEARKSPRYGEAVDKEEVEGTGSEHRRDRQQEARRAIRLTEPHRGSGELMQRNPAQ